MSGAGRGRVTLAVILIVCGGIAVAGGVVSPWVRFEFARDVGGVPITDVETLSGIALAPRLLPLGLAGAALGLVVLVTRGRLQQAAAVAVLLLGLVAGAFIVLGAGDAPPDGTLGAGVAFAALGAMMLVLGGVLGLRPARPARLPDRYDLDVDHADDEWRMASEEDEDDEGAA